MTLISLKYLLFCIWTWYLYKKDRRYHFISVRLRLFPSKFYIFLTEHYFMVFKAKIKFGVWKTIYLLSKKCFLYWFQHLLIFGRFSASFRTTVIFTVLGKSGKSGSSKIQKLRILSKYAVQKTFQIEK